MNAQRRRRILAEKIFVNACRIITAFAVVILLGLVVHIFLEGFPWLSAEFFNNFPSRFAQKSGVKASIYGSLWLMLFTALFSIPFGIGTAIFLEEYAPRKNKLVRLIEINIANLAGMPSIVYGLLGLAIFVRFFNLGRSVLAGSLTLALLVLPVIIIASQHAIRAVSKDIKMGAYALGARKWHVVFHHILPNAAGGILTGIILSLSRAIGETAPLIVVGALSYVSFVPEGPMDSFTSLPVQIYNWASRPKVEFHGLAAAAILVLLAILISMNLTAILIRNKLGRNKL
jgi:phosphate transport system permease protein